MGLEVGQRVGDYEILGVLGAGGMGQVYRVRNTLSDRIEAMKVLLPSLNAEPETAARFMIEIRTLAAFSHPNIAQLRTAFHLENQLVMLMELVEGQTVEYKAKRGRIPQEEALGYVLQLLSALGYAHARGVVHRDIKPANLMLTPRGVVKLMDFGIAKSEVQAQLTRPGTTVGSLHYMSPEQMRGSAVDSRSDLYSVGVLLYELLAGRRPFESNGMYSIVHLQLNMPPQPPIEINPLISRPLNDLILQSLAKDPAARFQSAEAFARALRALTAQPPQPKPLAPSQAIAPNPSGALRPVAYRPASPARAASVFVVPAPSPAPPAVRAAAPQPSPQPPGAPSFWSRLGWVGAGAFAVIVVAGAAVEIPLLLKTSASTTGDGSSVPSSTAVSTSVGAIDPDFARAREQMQQLELRANAVDGKLIRQSTGGGARPDLDRQYTQMHSHLQAAENDLKNRDIVASRKEMGKAQKDLSALESNLSQ
jgi:eukaryotic-like serine/threonine-protein kinase